MGGGEMDKLGAAIGTAGGLAAIGGLIDFYMRKGEKKKLIDWMIAWWIRFDDVKWSNFGRKEAEVVVRTLDRHAGDSLISVRRWIFSIGVCALVYLGVVIWLATSVFLIGDTWHHIFSYMERALTSEGALIRVTITTIAFALSLSLTRFIAALSARLSVNAIATALSFGVLLIIHLVLFAIWTNIVVSRSIDGIYDGLTPGPDGFIDSLIRQFGNMEGDLRTLGSNIMWSENWFGISWTFQNLLYEFWNGDPKTESPGVMTVLTGAAFNFVMDLISNGLRILYAVVFLASFLISPIVKPIISRTWEALIESNKPIFTMILGAIGTGLGVFHVLAK